MKITRVFVTDLAIGLEDITQVGDPAPRWRQMTGDVRATGIGFLEDHTEIQLDPIRLTIEEKNQVLEVAAVIAGRLANQPREGGKGE